MDYINRIFDMYDGNISLQPSYKGSCSENVPDELYSILQVSNGILETMSSPKTGEKIPITWILFSYEKIIEETSFFKSEYGVEGIVFADDGAGNPYVLKSDGKIMCYNVIDNEETQIACSLCDFYKR